MVAIELRDGEREREKVIIPSFSPSLFSNMESPLTTCQAQSSKEKQLISRETQKSKGEIQICEQYQ